MKKWKVGAYVRLSSDDGDKTESNSITNQKSIIRLFSKKNADIESVEYYIDDGYTGTSFERPDFKRMINDLSNGKINGVVVKDLSRLGRNYIEVGNYINDVFPKYCARFVAINDNIDSYKDPESVNNIIVPFKNLMNDEYARDISNKVRSVLDNKKENGQFIGSFAPYGYIKDPKNKHNFIVDKDAEKVIKKIFQMILSGKSKKEVVYMLNELKILPPRLHKIESSIYNYSLSDSIRKWNTKKLDDILRNQSYTGDLIQGKRKKISHKIHKNMRVNCDKWVVIENHHRAIISKKDFNRVQELIYERAIRVGKNNNYDLFTGHLRCNECGNNLILKKSKGYEYYYCSTFLSKKNCSNHSYNKKKLEEEIEIIINKYKKIINEMDRNIKEIISDTNINYDMEIIKTKMESNNKKIDNFILLKNDIKNDLKENLITEDEYWEYSAEYSKKIQELQKEQTELSNKLNENNNNNSNEKQKWMKNIQQLGDSYELNKILINELIEDIVIDEKKNIKVIFKGEDKYFEAIDFIKQHKCDIICTNQKAI